jgi:hypothetical protein
VGRVACWNFRLSVRAFCPASFVRPVYPGTVEAIAMSEKTNKKPVDARSKIDALFATSPAKVRVRAADDGKVYSGVVGSALVEKFAAAGQDDAFVALGLVNAETLKRSSKTMDANANTVSLTQDAIAK